MAKLEVKNMPKDKAKEIVAEAKKIARRADSWISFTNALSDPTGGLIMRYFPNAAERQAFLRSPDYELLNQLTLEIIQRRGLYPLPTHKKNLSVG
jgi:hypothetical protein